MTPDERAAGDAIRDHVFRWQRHVCFAQGVSPVCIGRCEDPHEIVPRGAGGVKSLANTVGVCRPCHNAAQGRVGGNRLIFDWTGRAEGQPPQANKRGQVWCWWRSSDQVIAQNAVA
jgi:5-methylcytosine-specific restriction endonuclease McrA